MPSKHEDGGRSRRTKASTRRARGGWSLHKQAFFSVLLLSFTSLGASLYLVGQPPQNPIAQELAATCSMTWKLGFMSILALIGGNMLDGRDSESKSKPSAGHDSEPKSKPPAGQQEG